MAYTHPDIDADGLHKYCERFHDKESQNACKQYVSHGAANPTLQQQVAAEAGAAQGMLTGMFQGHDFTLYRGIKGSLATQIWTASQKQGKVRAVQIAASGPESWSLSARIAEHFANGDYPNQDGVVLEMTIGARHNEEDIMGFFPLFPSDCPVREEEVVLNRSGPVAVRVRRPTR